MRQARPAAGSTASRRRDGGELGGVLLGELPLGLRRERSRADPEEPVAIVVESPRQPGGRLLHAAVLGEPARQLLGGLLRLELGELGVLVGEERARLELEQRGDEDEEFAAGLEVELVALGEQLDERDDDARDVDLGEIELLPQDERQQEVEGPSKASRSSSSSRTTIRARLSPGSAARPRNPSSPGHEPRREDGSRGRPPGRASPQW